MPTKVWRSRMLLDIYDLAREGLSDRAISRNLKVSYEIFKIWKKQKSRVRLALERGRGKKGESEKFAESIQEYVYRQMPDRLKEMFDQLNEWSKAPNYLERCEQLFKSQGKNVRQRLFVEFLIQRRFNASEACRMVGIAKSTLDHWVRNDPGFSELLEEIQWHKKNYLDGAYWRLVAKGSEAAILQGQKSLNADRGFAQVTKLTVDGKVEHDHDHAVRFESLPLKLRKRILRQIEEQKALGEAIPDAEILTETK